VNAHPWAQSFLYHNRVISSKSLEAISEGTRRAVSYG
jgi:hypothetical protein